MKFISDLTTSHRPWLLLAFSALILEISALYFQYVLGLEPCIMCIYQRVAIWGIFLAGVVGFIGHKWVLARILAYGLWGTGAIWGILIALEHVEMQTSTLSFLYSCEFIPNFPSWAPLHEWIPALFEARGTCSDIDWHFMDYSMPQWMIAVYSIYAALFATVLISRLSQEKMF